MRYCLVLLALLGLPAAAQTPTQALAQQWDTICATAVNGTELFVRCDETASSSDPNANLTAAAGKRLEEIPGQARTAIVLTSGVLMVAEFQLATSHPKASKALHYVGQVLAALVAGKPVPVAPTL